MAGKKSLSEKYPSLNLAYEQVKDILIQQKETIRDYRSRAITLLVVATAVVGVGIPIGFTEELKNIVLFGSFTVLTLL
jgi:hypothetical protein